MRYQTDKKILDCLRKGDTKAFEHVFLSYHTKIKHFICSLIKSEDDAEDLTQDIFMKLWHSRGMIDTQKSFSSYMYTMARNAAFNHIKHKNVCDSYAGRVTVSDTATGITPEDIIYAEEINLLAEMVVSQMPAQREKIYRLSRHEGLSNEEIATRLKISKKTVENQISIALKSIRKVITACNMLFL